MLAWSALRPNRPVIFATPSLSVFFFLARLLVSLSVLYWRMSDFDVQLSSCTIDFYYHKQLGRSRVTHARKSCKLSYINMFHSQ